MGDIISKVYSSETWRYGDIPFVPNMQNLDLAMISYDFQICPFTFGVLHLLTLSPNKKCWAAPEQRLFRHQKVDGRSIMPLPQSDSKSFAPEWLLFVRGKSWTLHITYVMWEWVSENIISKKLKKECEFVDDDAYAPNLCTTMSWSVSSLSNRLKSHVAEHRIEKLTMFSIAAWALWDYWRSCDLQPQPCKARIAILLVFKENSKDLRKIATQCHKCPTNKSGIEMPSFRPSNVKSRLKFQRICVWIKTHVIMQYWKSHLWAHIW